MTANPFAALKPALELILREGKVLPATGQAMEDLMRPDHAEVVDRLRMGEDSHLEAMLEMPNRKPYVPLTPLHRRERHLLRYFLDGSARTFFLGDVVEGDRRSPVHVAQIGAAAVHRRDNGQVRVAGSDHKIVLMMDKSKISFGDAVEEIVRTAGRRFAFKDVMEKDGES